MHLPHIIKEPLAVLFMNRYVGRKVHFLSDADSAHLQLPLWPLVLFACYSAMVIGWGLTFPTGADAAASLQKVRLHLTPDEHSLDIISCCVVPYDEGNMTRDLGLFRTRLSLHGQICTLQQLRPAALQPGGGGRSGVSSSSSNRERGAFCWRVWDADCTQPCRVAAALMPVHTAVY